MASSARERNRRTDLPLTRLDTSCRPKSTRLAQLRANVTRVLLPYADDSTSQTCKPQRELSQMFPLTPIPSTPGPPRQSKNKKKPSKGTQAITQSPTFVAVRAPSEAATPTSSAGASKFSETTTQPSDDCTFYDYMKGLDARADAEHSGVGALHSHKDKASAEACEVRTKAPHQQCTSPIAGASESSMVSGADLGGGGYALSKRSGMENMQHHNQAMTACPADLITGAVLPSLRRVKQQALRKQISFKDLSERFKDSFGDKRTRVLTQMKSDAVLGRTRTEWPVTVYPVPATPSKRSGLRNTVSIDGNSDRISEDEPVEKQSDPFVGGSVSNPALPGGEVTPWIYQQDSGKFFDLDKATTADDQCEVQAFKSRYPAPPAPPSPTKMQGHSLRNAKSNTSIRSISSMAPSIAPSKRSLDVRTVNSDSSPLTYVSRAAKSPALPSSPADPDWPEAIEYVQWQIAEEKAKEAVKAAEEVVKRKASPKEVKEAERQARIRAAALLIDRSSMYGMTPTKDYAEMTEEELELYGSAIQEEITKGNALKGIKALFKPVGVDQAKILKLAYLDRQMSLVGRATRSKAARPMNAAHQAEADDEGEEAEMHISEALHLLDDDDTGEVSNPIGCDAPVQPTSARARVEVTTAHRSDSQHSQRHHQAPCHDLAEVQPLCTQDNDVSQEQDTELLITPEVDEAYLRNVLNRSPGLSTEYGDTLAERQNALTALSALSPTNSASSSPVLLGLGITNMDDAMPARDFGIMSRLSMRHDSQPSLPQAESCSSYTASDYSQDVDGRVPSYDVAPLKVSCSPILHVDHLKNHKAFTPNRSESFLRKIKMASQARAAKLEGSHPAMRATAATSGSFETMPPFTAPLRIMQDDGWITARKHKGDNLLQDQHHPRASESGQTPPLTGPLPFSRWELRQTEREHEERGLLQSHPMFDGHRETGASNAHPAEDFRTAAQCAQTQPLQSVNTKSLFPEDEGYSTGQLDEQRFTAPDTNLEVWPSQSTTSYQDVHETLKSLDNFFGCGSSDAASISGSTTTKSDDEVNDILALRPSMKHKGKGRADSLNVPINHDIGEMSTDNILQPSIGIEIDEAIEEWRICSASNQSLRHVGSIQRPDNMQALRAEVALSPRKLRASKHETRHPNHEFTWETENMMCYRSHSAVEAMSDGLDSPQETECSMSDLARTYSVDRPLAKELPKMGLQQCENCARFCCAYAENLYASTTYGRTEDAEYVRYKAERKAQRLRSLYPDGIEEYSTFLTCMECSSTVCPSCAMVCEEDICRQVICKEHGRDGRCSYHQYI